MRHVPATPAGTCCPRGIPGDRADETHSPRRGPLRRRGAFRGVVRLDRARPTAPPPSPALAVPPTDAPPAAFHTWMVAEGVIPAGRKPR